MPSSNNLLLPYTFPASHTPLPDYCSSQLFPDALLPVSFLLFSGSFHAVLPLPYISPGFHTPLPDYYNPQLFPDALLPAPFLLYSNSFYSVLLLPYTFPATYIPLPTRNQSLPSPNVLDQAVFLLSFAHAAAFFHSQNNALYFSPPLPARSKHMPLLIFVLMPPVHLHSLTPVHLLQE